MKFTVRWDPSFEYRGDHFYGQSLSQLCALAGEHDYDLVELHYNNAFLAPSERHALPALTAEEAYEAGYVSRRDRLDKFPWNRDMESVHALAPEGAIEFVNRYFAQYAGKYLLSK